MPLLLTWEAVGDSCSEAATDAVSNAVTGILGDLAASATDQALTANPPEASALPMNTADAQTDCAAVVSHTGTGLTCPGRVCCPYPAT